MVAPEFRGSAVVLVRSISGLLAAVMQRFLRLIGIVDPPSRLVTLPMMPRVVRADRKRMGRHA
jgi:hypothetical protein